MLFILLGILGGILSGLFGVGGASVYIPALVIAGHIPQNQAQGLALLVMIPVTLLAFMHYRQKGFVARPALAFLILGSLAGTFAGSYLANTINPQALKWLFAVFLAYNGLTMLIRP
ncbi:MAG: sulfite exporter TauE/SafE family protein [Candidatus Margulisbacteria bacterium]|jgi:uncharacterized membrane protein YfcA|nr:sulfite exporter TauE/SafE family protein [Candidatus Margulisiibacteriota bacterium]